MNIYPQLFSTHVQLYVSQFYSHFFFTTAVVNKNLQTMRICKDRIIRSNS